MVNHEIQNLSIKPELEEALKRLPTSPGVYRMYDASDTVIYVGKALHLKKRVQSYFNQSDKSSKTQALVRQIEKIEVTITRSETEALLLESQLIKALKPKYNILMRDDKSYPYLYLKLKHEFPSLSLVRHKKNPQETGYFGPYPSAGAVRETLSFVQKHFKLRNCRDTDFKARKRPCLQYQIGRCTAPCVGLISQSDYQIQVEDATQFLAGKSQTLLKALAKRMAVFAEQMAFEQAALVRDQIKHLRLIQEQQGMSSRLGNVDVIVGKMTLGVGCIQWVSVRNGEIIDTQSFFPRLPSGDLLEPESADQSMLKAFFSYFYLDYPARIPKQIVLDVSLSDKAGFEALFKAKSGHVCHIETATRGIKRRWLEFAYDNLMRAMQDKLSSKAMMAARFEALEKVLKVNRSIELMTCFDISHTQGQDTVASCVVFDRNGPLKSAYRRFNIEGITPGDDYAAMNQAVSRYFKGLLKTAKPWPELLLIDGGRGQVAAAQKALDGLNGPSIHILGIAKGVTRKAGLERLILAKTKEEFALAADSDALHLLQHIRDEAHRFAITAHRKKRAKHALASSLLDIPGVGDMRRQALITHFGGLKALIKAPLAEIEKVDGINETLAQKIYSHLRGE